MEFVVHLADGSVFWSISSVPCVRGSVSFSRWMMVEQMNSSFFKEQEWTCGGLCVFACVCPW